jgi:hypothetical protein
MTSPSPAVPSVVNLIEFLSYFYLVPPAGAFGIFKLSTTDADGKAFLFNSN